MHLNNLIIALLYVPVAYFYLSYFGIQSTFGLHSILRRRANRLLVLFSIGVLFACFIGYTEGRFPSSYAQIDLSRILNLLLIFIVPLSWKRHRILKSRLFHKVLFGGLFIFTLSVGGSLFTQGMGKSAFYGNILGATTINLTMVSVISFYGLFQYYFNHKSAGLFLSIIAWLISLASLAKWNFWVDITIPVLIFKILLHTKIKNRLNKIILVPLIVIGLISISPFLVKYLNDFALIQNYSSIEHYLNSRVLQSSNANILSQTGAVMSIGGKGLSDGARFSMWFDLLSRTWDQPIRGLGFGARAFDYQGLDVEDHSVLVFLLSRFGFLLGLLILFQLIKTLKAFYNLFNNINYPQLKYIFLALLCNFIFQGMVGMIWGQLPVTLLMSLVLGVMLHQHLLGNDKKYEK